MKRIFTSGFLGLVISGLLLASCSQMASYENEDLTLEQASADKAGFKLNPFGTNGNENAALIDCAAGCITERVLLNTDLSVAIGGSGKSKNVNFQIWNTSEQLLIQIISNVATDKVLYTINGTQYTYDPAVDIPKDTYFIIYFDLPEGYEACEYTLESLRVDGGGAQLYYTNIGYGVYEYCPTGCDEEFSYDDNGDALPYTFYYTPSEDMTDVLVEFTFAQGVAVSGLPAEFTRNGGNSSVWSATLSFDACTEYTWTVDLNPDCSGNSQNSNVWTDFKVASISKKGSLENITESCSN